LIDGVNDADEHADRLVRLLVGLPVKVNLIPMNDVDGSGLRASPPERVKSFQARVAGFGVSCFVRARRGDEVSAACGQLALAPGLIELGRSRAPA
jgi:23S rRNA (adenine2503-C2)-methyltransferase